MLKTLVIIFLACYTGTALETDQPDAEGKQSVAEKSPALWAVLVAGSNMYYNYRHQADVCHAYNDLIAHGVPESNIIVMMYDDIANSTENPTRGIIVNQPNGTDVYKGVPKHYTGKDVKAKNFLKLLLGDKSLTKKGKKVLQSGPNDHVFIYFADHGGTKVLNFPNDVLYASEFVSTLKKMHKKGKYGKMVIYVEACESGSMFKDILPKDLSVYATTAANQMESSWACFWDEYRQTFLGDEYSVNWLLDSDVGRSFLNETLEDQFQRVKQETRDSHPMQFGDLGISQLPVAQFQGAQVPPSKPNKLTKCDDAISSVEVPLEIVRRKIAKASSPVEKEELQMQLTTMTQAREYLNRTVRAIVTDICSQGHCEFNEDLMSTRKSDITHHKCAEQSIKMFSKHCFNLSQHTYALQFLSPIVNVVESFDKQNFGGQCNAFKENLRKVCQKRVANNPYTKIV